MALLIPAFLLIDIRLHYISVVRVYNIGLLLIGLLFLLRFKVRKPYLYTMIGMAFVGAVIFFLVYRYGSMIGG